MTVLGLDTSTPALSVAVVRGGEVLAEIERPPGADHAVLLPQLASDALAEAGVRLGDLSGIAVGIGPGAFTGLRVSIATAKGLAYGARVPLAGVSSLAALARAGAERAPHAAAIVPVLDARRGELYAAAFAPGGEPLLPELVAAPGRLAEELARIPGPVVLLGPGYELHRSVLDAAVGAPLAVDGLPAAPPAREIARLARFLPFDPRAIAALEPRYLRSSDRDLSLGPPRPP